MLGLRLWLPPALSVIPSNVKSASPPYYWIDNTGNLPVEWWQVVWSRCHRLGASMGLIGDSWVCKTNSPFPLQTLSAGLNGQEVIGSRNHLSGVTPLFYSRSGNHTSSSYFVGWKRLVYGNVYDVVQWWVQIPKSGINTFQYHGFDTSPKYRYHLIPHSSINTNVTIRTSIVISDTWHH